MFDLNDKVAKIYNEGLSYFIIRNKYSDYKTYLIYCL